MGLGKSQEDEERKKSSSISRGSVVRSLGTTFSAQSVSTSGSQGSPAMTTPVKESTFVRLNRLDIQGEDEGSQSACASASASASVGPKKKRGQRAVGGDKSRGLRQFSMKVCEKVESKGRTTYNEVADELVAEFTDPKNVLTSPDQQQYDEKNIRRRVYDALNVLMAMDIISKDKKEIQWKGLPRTTMNGIEELKAEHEVLRNRLDKKAAYLQELEDQFAGLQNLTQRNERLYASGDEPTGGVALPFILIQTRPHATVELELSEDMQMVHFDFNSTPFKLHDDNYVLKAMGLCERPKADDNGAHNSTANGGESVNMYQHDMYQSHINFPLGSHAAGRPRPSPSIPGILKARAKHDH